MDLNFLKLLFGKVPIYTKTKTKSTIHWYTCTRIRCRMQPDEEGWKYASVCEQPRHTQSNKTTKVESTRSSVNINHDIRNPTRLRRLKVRVRLWTTTTYIVEGKDCKYSPSVHLKHYNLRCTLAKLCPQVAVSAGFGHYCTLKVSHCAALWSNTLNCAHNMMLSVLLLLFVDQPCTLLLRWFTPCLAWVCLLASQPQTLNQQN